MTITAVSVGDNCIDHYLSPIDKLFTGGNALNVAIHLNRWKIPSAYVGAVGEDEYGQTILSNLEKEGVDVSHLQVLPGSTAITDIVIKEGDRIFVREEFGVVEKFRINQQILNFISNHSLVHFSILGTDFSYLDQLKQSEIKISFDYSSPDRYNLDFLRSTAPFVDFAFFSIPHIRSDHEVMKFAKTMKSHGPVMIIVTRGDKGSLVLFEDKFHQQAAIDTHVIDTLGAGDAFIGVFLANQLLGKSIFESLLFASTEAARTCTHYGAWLTKQNY